MRADCSQHHGGHGAEIHSWRLIKEASASFLGTVTEAVHGDFFRVALDSGAFGLIAVVYDASRRSGAASIVAGRVLKQLGVIGRHETNSGSASDICRLRSCSWDYEPRSQIRRGLQSGLT